jgi:hypothetical protein
MTGHKTVRRGRIAMAKKRRGKGEGNVRLRSDSRWEARISLGGYGTSRRVKSIACLSGAMDENRIELSLS